MSAERTTKPLDKIAENYLSCTYGFVFPEEIDVTDEVKKMYDILGKKKRTKQRLSEAYIDALFYRCSTKILTYDEIVKMLDSKGYKVKRRWSWIEGKANVTYPRIIPIDKAITVLRMLLEGYLTDEDFMSKIFYINRYSFILAYSYLYGPLVDKNGKPIKLSKSTFSRLFYALAAAGYIHIWSERWEIDSKGKTWRPYELTFGYFVVPLPKLLMEWNLLTHIHARMHISYKNHNFNLSKEYFPKYKHVLYSQYRSIFNGNLVLVYPNMKELIETEVWDILPFGLRLYAIDLATYKRMREVRTLQEIVRMYAPLLVGRGHINKAVSEMEAFVRKYNSVKRKERSPFEVVDAFYSTLIKLAYVGNKKLKYIAITIDRDSISNLAIRYADKLSCNINDYDHEVINKILLVRGNKWLYDTFSRIGIVAKATEEKFTKFLAERNTLEYTGVT